MDLFNENKRHIAEAIYYAEIVADQDGRSVAEILKQNSDDIKKIDSKEIELSQKLKMISQKISKGDREEKIYAEYVDPEVLYFMVEASNNGMKRGEIVSKYLPIKSVAAKTTRKIKNKLKIPIIIALFGLLFMGYVLKDFVKIMKNGSIEADFTVALWVADYYYLLSMGILLSLAVPLILFPHKVPKIKGLFTKINGMMAILIIAILNKVGQSPVQIIPFIQRTFQIKGFYAKKNDMDDLAKLLYHAKFINFFQASRIMGIKSIKRDFPLVLDSILEELRLDVELSSELIEEAVGTLTTFIVLLPVTPALYVIGSVIGNLAVQAFASI